VRRIVAVTGEDALKAIAEGDRLVAEMEAAKRLPDADLDKALTAFKQVQKEYKCLLSHCRSLNLQPHLRVLATLL
jgi:alanyl-tRNA synthetase